MSFRIQRYDLLRRGTMDCSDDGTLFTCVDMGDNGFYGCLNSKSDCDPCQDDCSSDLKAWYPSEQPPVGNTDEVHCHDSSTPYFCQAPEQPFFGCCKSDPCASNICNNADVVAMYVASSLIATATDSIDAIAAPTDSPNTDSSGTSPSDTNPSSADSSSIPFTSTDSSSTTSSTTSSPSTNHPIPGPSGIASISQVSGLVSIPVTTSKLPSKTTVFSQVAATTSESSSTPQPTATSHASGAGVIAGATIGGLACLALIGALALLFYCRSKLSRKHMNDIGPLPNAPNPVSTPKQDLPDPPPNSKQGLEEPPMLASGIDQPILTDPIHHRPSAPVNLSQSRDLHSFLSEFAADTSDTTSELASNPPAYISASTRPSSLSTNPHISVFSEAEVTPRANSLIVPDSTLQRRVLSNELSAENPGGEH